MRLAAIALLLGSALSCGEASEATTSDAGRGGSSGSAPDATKAGALDCGGHGCAVTALALGSAAACALLEDRTVACYGGGIVGTLGREERPEVDPTPTRVPGLEGVSAIFAGAYTVCAVVLGSALWCWGPDQAENPYSTRVGNTVPTRVPGLSDVVQVAPALSHTCALTGAGDVFCWGSNYFGELGDGTLENRRAPVKVAGVSGARAIATGMELSCALLENGSVMCWGMNDKGQLGRGEADALVHPEPGEVTALSGAVAAIAASANAESVCALGEGGGVTCWGEPIEGAPVGSAATALAVGWKHACVLAGDGEVRCWGQSDRGQLGAGHTSPSSAPVEVVGVRGAVSLAAGGHSSCVVFDGGAFACWGDNKRGQLGDGTTDTTRATPVMLRF
jgi:alpha-tubulin suppressor-like RCC1 family protein